MAKDYKIRGTLTGSTARPKHKLPFSAKKSTKDGEASDWGADAIDYYGGQTSITSTMRQEMRVLYRLANGVIDESDYSFVLSPYGAEQRKREELQGDPARLRNYDIIGPVVSRVIGDFMVRDTSFQVVATNTDVEERRQDMIRIELKQQLLQEFRNELAAQGIDTGFTDPNIELQVEQVLNSAENVPDTMTMKGQDALDYITYYNELERKYRMGLGDYLTVGRVFTYRDVFRNDTIFEVINPLDFDYVASPNIEFIEDGEACHHTQSLTLGEVIDFFREDLTDDEIDWLESEHGGGGVGFQSRGSDISTSGDRDTDWKRHDMETLVGNIFGARQGRTNSNVIVKHVVFKSKVKIGKLPTVAMDGSETYIEVSEDFKPRKGEEVEWMWVDQVWEGYKISNLMYKRVRPVPLQRGTAEKPGCKLPYNGRTYGQRTAVPNTPVKKGKTHQELYNIFKYRMERTVAKNKDKFTVIPLGLVPETDDMDMYSMMYYADYHGYMFIDETNPKAMQALQALKAVDVSMREYIKFLHDICIAIRAEYMEIVGINRQKMADVKASDDVGNTQTALHEASLILEDTFVSYEELIERDYQALLDLSKFAWIDGKKSQFLNANGELTMLDVDPYMHAATDYSIFVKGNKAEREKLNQMKALSQAFAQNSATPTMVGRILQANNFDTLMKELEKMEKDMMAREDAAGQAQQQQVAQEAQDKQADREEARYKTDTDNKTKIDVALIKEQGAISTSLLGADGQNEEAIGRANKTLDDMFDKNEQANLEWAKNQTAREGKATDMAIAKENRNQHEIRADK